MLKCFTVLCSRYEGPPIYIHTHTHTHIHTYTHTHIYIYIYVYVYIYIYICIIYVHVYVYILDISGITYYQNRATLCYHIFGLSGRRHTEQ